MIYLLLTVLGVILLIPAVVGLIVGLKTNAWSDVGIWYVKSVSTFLVGIPVTLAGFPIVAIALPFRIEHPETEVQFSDPRYASQGAHRLVTLPAWAKPWDNIFDGAWGDRRGWWNNYCLENYKKDCTAFRSMWQWLACRNPANYFSRVMTGVDVSLCTITVLGGVGEVVEEPGVSNWQFLVATRIDGKKYHRFFCSLPWWFDQGHAVMFDIGWKIKLAHNGISMDAPIKNRIKGSVFTPSFWKAL